MLALALGQGTAAVASSCGFMHLRDALVGNNLRVALTMLVQQLPTDLRPIMSPDKPPGQLEPVPRITAYVSPATPRSSAWSYQAPAAQFCFIIHGAHARLKPQ